jgi:ferredoxin
MIVTKQKSLDEILRVLGNGAVFLIGCNECATLCHTGGTDELVALKAALEKQKIPVSGFVVLEPACHLNNDKRMLKEYSKELGKAEKVLVLACGNGSQTVAELFADKEVVSGTDTLFLGEISRASEFDKRCVLCGECILDSFGGLCPVSRCPKSMLNGPCGGASGGKCEVNRDLECLWDRVYQELKKKGKLQKLSVIQKPKDWSKGLEMKRRV